MSNNWTRGQGKPDPQLVITTVSVGKLRFAARFDLAVVGLVVLFFVSSFTRLRSAGLACLGTAPAA